MRKKNEDLAYPYYWWGVFFAFLFAFFSAMNFITIRGLGGNIHVSLKTFYFGVISSTVTALYCIYADPQIFYFWRIATNNYSMTRNEFLGSLAVGFFSWSSQESMSIALGIVKSGTVSAFYNVALVMAFMTDVLYFKREIFTTDVIGACMIIIFTTLQGIISNMDH